MVISKPAPLASLANLRDKLPHAWLTERPNDEVEPLIMAQGPDLVQQAELLPGGQLVPLVVEDGSGFGYTTAAIVDEGTWICDGNQVLNSEAERLLAMTNPSSQVPPADSGALGEVIAQVVQAGGRHLIIRLGESLNHDAGLGMLIALAQHAGLPSLTMATLTPEQIPQLLTSVRSFLGSLRITLAVDYEATFTGLGGAGASLSERAGLDGAFTQGLEHHLLSYIREAEQWLATRQLMSSAPSARPFTRSGLGGAGGGAAAMLLTLGASVSNTGQVSAQIAGLNSLAFDPELIVVVVNELDGIAIGDGVVGQVTAKYSQELCPVVVVCRHAYASPRQYAQAGIHAVYELQDLYARANPDWNLDLALDDRIGRVARNWSSSR